MAELDPSGLTTDRLPPEERSGVPPPRGPLTPLPAIKHRLPDIPELKERFASAGDFQLREARRRAPGFQALMLAVGYIFLILGLIGFVVPILQGVLFTSIGLIILSKHSAWAHRCLVWFKARHPSFDRSVGWAEDHIDRWENKLERRFFG